MEFKIKWILYMYLVKFYLMLIKFWNFIENVIHGLIGGHDQIYYVFFTENKGNNYFYIDLFINYSFS